MECGPFSGRGEGVDAEARWIFVCTFQVVSAEAFDGGPGHEEKVGMAGAGIPVQDNVVGLGEQGVKARGPRAPGLDVIGCMWMASECEGRREDVRGGAFCSFSRAAFWSW